MDTPSWHRPGNLTQMTVFGGTEPFMMVDAGDNMFDFSDLDSVLRVCRNWKVNFPILHFSFGLPESLEARHREARIRAIQYLRENGIHPAAYVKFNGIFASSFFREDLGGIPQAKDWIHKTPDGFWFGYWIYPERYMMCLSNRGWLEQYLLDRAWKAVDAGAEAIFLDNLEAGAPCYCDSCKEGFRQHLKESFSEDQLRRLGIEDVTGLDPSALMPQTFRDLDEAEGSFFANVPWKNRVFQEWLAYQARVIANCLNEFGRRMREYARDRYGRDLLIVPNFGGFKDPRRFALKRINFELLDHDITWFEWDYPHSYSQLQFVRALTKGKPVSSYGKDLLHVYGDIWQVSGVQSDPTFPRRWPGWYNGYTPSAETALVCSLSTILYDEGFDAFGKVVETLCRQVPVEAVSLNLLSLEELLHYRCLALPRVTCLSEAEAQKLAAFAERGGKVMTSSGTGTLDEHGQPFHDHSKGVARAIISSLPPGGRRQVGTGEIVCATGLDDLIKRVLIEVDHRVRVLEGSTDFLMSCLRDDRLTERLIGDKDDPLAPITGATTDGVPAGVKSRVEGDVPGTAAGHEEDEGFTIRLGGASGLMLAIRKDRGKMFPVLAAPSQEHLGSRPIRPVYENGTHTVVAVPDTKGFAILKCLDHPKQVNLSISPSFGWLDAAEETVSAKLMVSNLSAVEQEVELKAEVFEPSENQTESQNGWRLRFEDVPGANEPAHDGNGPEQNGCKPRDVDGQHAGSLKLRLAPETSSELRLSAILPGKETELFPTVLVTATDPESGLELDRAALKLQRAAAIFERYSIDRSGPDDEHNLDRAGLGVVLLNRADALACRTFTVKSHRGSPGREMPESQLIPRNGIITGFVPSSYPWPRDQRPRFIRPFAGFSPGLGSYLISDRIYDQNRPDGALNFTARVLDDGPGSVAALFEFDQPPFHVIQTVRASSTAPGFLLTYEMEALSDGLVYSWYLPRFGVPAGAEVIVGKGREGKGVQVTPGDLPAPEDGLLKFLLREQGRVLTIEFGSLDIYGGFRRKPPFLAQSNLSFESPILCIPVTHRSALDVRTGDRYRVEFTMRLDELE